jgi:hypothetical protein
MIHAVFLNPVSAFLFRFLEPDVMDLCTDDTFTVSSKWNEKHRKLTEMIGHVLEDYSLIKFAPLNIKDEDSLANILFMVDNCIQFGEDRYHFSIANNYKTD